jgi:hypothetical protein
MPNEQISNARKAFFLFAFAKPFSRYADSRLWAFIKNELQPLVKEGNSSFPLNEAFEWVTYWEHIKAFNIELLQRNILLALHLVQHKSGAKVQYERNLPQIDHIFPRSKLRELGVSELETNNLANYWILAQGKNQNKSAQHPANYFADVPDDELQRALIDRDYLDYRRYTTFLKLRSETILDKVKDTIKIKDKDLKSSDDSKS